jgi:hypothetical protein
MCFVNLVQLSDLLVCKIDDLAILEDARVGHGLGQH